MTVAALSGGDALAAAAWTASCIALAGLTALFLLVVVRPVRQIEQAEDLIKSVKTFSPEQIEKLACLPWAAIEEAITRVDVDADRRRYLRDALLQNMSSLGGQGTKPKRGV